MSLAGSWNSSRREKSTSSVDEGPAFHQPRWRMNYGSGVGPLITRAPLFGLKYSENVF